MVGMTGKPPMAAAGELAGALAEIRAMTPERLKEIEDTTKKFYEGAEKYAAEREAAEKALTTLADDKAAHAAKIQADNADIEERNRLVTARENHVRGRERAADELQTEVTAREQAVADGERRLAATGKQLEEFTT